MKGLCIASDRQKPRGNISIKKYINDILHQGCILTDPEESGVRIQKKVWAVLSEEFFYLLLAPGF
ncbi:MAG: hypothetical protein AB1611_08285 [bacterium]